MTVIAHLSDLHFGAEDPAVVAAILADVAAAKPDLVAISGDLTQRARTREYLAAAAFLRSLPAPWLAVPGNHDMPSFELLERFANPWRRWRQFIGPETEPDWRDDCVAVVGLNTARRGGFDFAWERGRVGSGRLARLEARLGAQPPQLFRIVLAHHPFAAPADSPRAPLVGGAARALAAFARQRVGMVLSGHLHLPDVAQAAGTRILLVQGATATSHRLRGRPNAWHRITVTAGSVEVASRVWDGQAWRDAAPVSA
ncbi:metallophosphoesterase [Falsiroseomonas bella]|uniref:Metallophosphoesterase n=1 Tax=Falsiroseomonas bella TaxID=2184016 RepID=A0A317FHL9_9PROT|nr:metallophosphoesterase [Falsiroseomonas bella]PWS38093.1 metallophosphoesterase [Falsiroseomonas bella]